MTIATLCHASFLTLHPAIAIIPSEPDPAFPLMAWRYSIAMILVVSVGLFLLCSMSLWLARRLFLSRFELQSWGDSRPPCDADIPSLKTKAEAGDRDSARRLTVYYAVGHGRRLEGYGEEYARWRKVVQQLKAGHDSAANA